MCSVPSWMRVRLGLEGVEMSAAGVAGRVAGRDEGGMDDVSAVG